MVISYHLFPPQTGEGEPRVFLEKKIRDSIRRSLEQL